MNILIMEDTFMDNIKIYKCNICGNIVIKLIDSGNPLSCCGQEMAALDPFTSDGKLEYHVPDCCIKHDVLKVKIGEKEHPTQEDHHIEWILVHTSDGFYFKSFDYEDKPETAITLCEHEKVCGVYAYCNIHGLFKTEYVQCKNKDHLEKDCKPDDKTGGMNSSMNSSMQNDMKGDMKDDMQNGKSCHKKW